MNQRSFSIELWPPSQSTRLMLVERMTKNLSTPSIFSKKYGALSTEEAQENAKQIEETAFVAANEHYVREPDGDGSSAVQLYAKKSSKHMLEVLKRGLQTMEKVDSPCVTVFDISGGRRTFIEAEEAEEILRPLSVKGNSYSKICFSDKSFGLGAARVAEPILISLKDQLTERSPALEDFRCSSTRVGSEGGITLAEALKNCTSLKRLDLTDNMFGVEVGVALSQALSSHVGLVEAYLSYLNLEDEGAIALANAFKECTPSLEVLEMAGNNMTAEAAPALASCIASKHLLKKLNLSENELKD
ncbi:Ran gtpase-activating protein, partial [Thalictrum thalictroides]